MMTRQVPNFNTVRITGKNLTLGDVVITGEYLFEKHQARPSTRQIKWGNCTSHVFLCHKFMACHCATQNFRALGISWNMVGGIPIFNLWIWKIGGEKWTKTGHQLLLVFRYLLQGSIPSPSIFASTNRLKCLFITLYLLLKFYLNRNNWRTWTW